MSPQEAKLVEDLDNISDIIPDGELAQKEAKEELESLYGFDFNEIAVRNDERLDDSPDKLVKERMENKQKYKRLGKAGEYVMAAGFAGGAITASQPKLLAGSALVTMAGYLGGIAAVGIGQTLQQMGLQKFDYFGSDEALVFLEDKDYVKAEGPLPYTLVGGEEAATDLEDLLESANESMLFYREHNDLGAENRFEVVCYIDHYPKADGENIEPEEYIFSGYADETPETSDRNIRDDFKSVREFLSIEEGPDPEENQIIKPL